MLLAILAAFLLVLFAVLAGQVSNLHGYFKQNDSPPDSLEELNLARNYSLLALATVAVFLLAAIYLVIKNTPWEGHILEWLNLIVRWFHVTIGIAWIGASFYFVFLENSLNRTKNLRPELAGNLWAVHGGGFYYLEKYKSAPEKIPAELHWFKYEAYFTWISGIALLFIVYYFNAGAMLIDKNIADISPATGIFIGVGTMLIGWIIYDMLCRTPLLNKGYWFAIIGFILSVALAWFLTHIFNSRAAYIHFGAVLGTLMAGNVFFVIIPSQKAMVQAAKEGKPLDPALGKYAGLRSLHNNYLTLPVLFVMISNHFPSTFGHGWNWAILAAIALASAFVKHFHNLLDRGNLAVGWLPLGFGMLLAVVFVTAPKSSENACNEPVTFVQIHAIFNERCVSCHSSQPTDELWTAPPNGVKYDTPQEIVNMKDKILQRVVLTRTMPQNNKTGMLPEEREIIRCWIEQGAKIE